VTTFALIQAGYGTILRRGAASAKRHRIENPGYRIVLNGDGSGGARE
jgi:hypothetical protein